MNKDKSIENLLEFYVRGDEALKRLKEKGVKGKGIEVKSRGEALEKEGYEIKFDVYSARLKAPKLPEPMRISCSYGDQRTVKVIIDKEGMYLSDSKNEGGWGSKNFYWNNSLGYGDNPLDWQWSSSSEQFDLKNRKWSKEKKGKSFIYLCANRLGKLYQGMFMYQGMFNTPGFYCGANIGSDSKTNTNKFARAVLFLRGVEDLVCSN